MSYKPIISKIRCHNPNLKSSKHANRGNAHYIATREGTDFSAILEEKQDNRMHNTATDEEYTRYIAKRPRSHGLFGNIETDDLKSVEQLIYKTSQKGTNIYRGIISLSERDAQELGYVNSSTWYQQLKAMMPDIAKELGISPTNFTWIGAFHAEPSHPHVHYQIWDNTDKIQSSFLHVSVQKRCRAVIEKAIFPEEYEKTLQAVFEAEKDELYSTKNASREQIMNYFKEVMDMKHVPGIEHTDMPSKLPTGESQKIATHLEQLKDLLPESGRMYYKFMTPDVKKKIDKISDIIFKQPEMKAALSKYLENANYIHQIKNPGYDKQAQDNAKKEIYRRAGNIILKAVSDDLEQKFLYEGQIQEKLIASQVESAQTIFKITETAPDTVDHTVYLQEQDEPLILDELNDTEKIQADFSGNYNEYYMEWSNPYKTALSFLYDENNYQNAINLLISEANKGNSLACAELGKIYSRGIGVEGNTEMADKYYRLAFTGFSQIDSENPSGYCKYRLGKLYESGLGTQQDLEKARDYFSAAVAENKHYAEYSLGKLYLSHIQDFSYSLKTDSAEILKLADTHLKSSADHGFPYGAYEYAKLHEGNTEISSLYYKKAYLGFQEMLSNREDDTLLYRLGKMTMEGKGTTQNIFSAIKYLEKSADLNNIYAKLAIAKLCLNTDFPELRDTTKALNILTNLSKQNNAEAQYTLGKFYLSEEFPEYRDITKALELLHASSDQGNQFAQYTLGKFYLSEEFLEYRDIPKALELLHASSDQGNQFAQYTLGKFYLSEEFPEYRDITKALELLHASSDQGNQFAQYMLGKFYLSEEFPEYRDIPKALELLHASSDQGNQFAQYMLGKFYLSEEFPEYRDITKALELLHASSDQGNQFAQYTLGKFYLSEEFPEYRDIPKALELLHASSDQGNQFAQYTLGKFYLSEEFPEYRDITKALELLHASSDQGNQFARYTLGKFYLSEEFPEYRDITKALELLHASSDQGNQFAQYTLGKFYLSEEFPEYRDITKALELLHASSDQGNQFAQLKLGNIYLYGKYSVEKNEKLGKEYLHSSAEQGNIYAKETLENYEFRHSSMYIMASLIYRGIYTAMIQSSYKKRQQMEDIKRDLSKQARIEKRKQEEIPHL